MSQTCLFVALVVVMCAQAEPQFNPYEFVNKFVPQPFFPLAPFPQPYIPNYGQILGQFGKAQGQIPLNGGNMQFESTNFGIGGNNFVKKTVKTFIGPDGKPIQKVYENINGVETEKEIEVEPNSGNSYRNSMIMSSGYGGGKYESTIFTSETGTNGETNIKVYKNKDGKKEVKEIKL